MKKPLVPKISFQGKRLIIEWDNREVPKNCFLTIFMAGFWVMWTPVTLFFTYLMFTGQGPTLFWAIWLIAGYVGVIGIPMAWVMRWTTERIEFDEKFYRTIT